MEEAKAPCKECKERRFIDERTTCHSVCEKYKKWVEKIHKEERELIQKRKMDQDSYSMFESMKIRKPLKGGKI